MSATRKDKLQELREQLTEVRTELLKLEDQLHGVRSLQRDLERAYRKAGGRDEPDLPHAFDDMDLQWDPGPPSKRPQYGKRAGDLFLHILIHMNKWMSPGELFRRAAFLGLKERKNGDFERSLQGLKRGRVRVRRRDGFVGLKEWPDEKG